MQHIIDYTTVSSKGQIVIPRALREACGLSSGMRLKVEPLEDGGFTLRPLANAPHPIMKLSGIFHKPGSKPLSRKAMKKLFMDHVAAMDEATKSAKKPTRKMKRKPRA